VVIGTRGVGVGVDVAIGGDTRGWRNGRGDGGSRDGMGWDGMGWIRGSYFFVRGKPGWVVGIAGHSLGYVCVAWAGKYHDVLCGGGRIDLYIWGWDSGSWGWGGTSGSVSGG